MSRLNVYIKSLAGLFVILSILAACNKVYTNPEPIPLPVTPAGNTLSRVLGATASDSLYNRLVIRSGIYTATPATVTDSSLRFTMFVPDNNAMKAFISGLSGGLLPVTAPDANFSAFTNTNIPVATAAGIVGYNTVPQLLRTSSFPTVFPNLQYATILNPAPTMSALLRLTNFPSKRAATTWVNNIPLTATDATATNGIIHHTAAVMLPPTGSLWARINADPDMTYFKAAIIRADSGTAVAPATVGALQSALDNIGANPTAFVPTDSAMRAALTGLIAQGLIAQGVPSAVALTQAGALAATPAVFTNPALYPAITATLVRGIAVYHLMSVRVFSVNMPATSANFPTLLNGAIPVHPGVSLQATFTGPVVTAASVKGVANSSPSILLLNPNPGSGSSDQLATNSVLHKINQVLLPQ